MISSQARLNNSTNKAVLKPIILELIRTQHCDVPLVLLLDKLHVVVSSRQYTDEDAYRIWLSDGANTIQAVFMPDLHPFLTAGEAREGSILVLTKYKLVRVDKYRCDGWVWVLVVSDMQIGGFDGRENSGMMVEFRGEEHVSTSIMKIEIDRVEAKAGDSFENTAPEIRQRQAKTRKRKLESDFKELSSPKSKVRKSNDTLGLEKVKARPALGERNANHQPRTATKSTSLKKR